MTKPFYQDPILNSPYLVPKRHHALGQDGQPLDHPPIPQWVPGFDNLKSYGRWDFVEFSDVFAIGQGFNNLFRDILTRKRVSEAA